MNFIDRFKNGLILLGNSFAGIYSSPELGWETSSSSMFTPSFRA